MFHQPRSARFDYLRAFIVMKVLSAFLVVLATVFIPPRVTSAMAADDFRWLVYYSDKAPTKAFEDYGLIVFDSQFHPPLRPLLDRGKTLLGYLSLGEVEEYRDYFGGVKAEGILLHESKHWKRSFTIDIRDRRWTKRVIERLMPDILRQGFDGIFLDTLDNPVELQRVHPKKYPTMTEAAARLVRTIRRHYPSIKIMMNRAYELLPLVEGHIDYVLGESVYADYDFEDKSYRRVPKSLYQKQVHLLAAAKKRRPDLRVYTLDYWDPEDLKGISGIYKEQRANGFVPYVAPFKLDRIIKEPKQ